MELMEPNPLPDYYFEDNMSWSSHKLYYYDNTKLFKCYTGGCSADGSDAFDIFELTRKVKRKAKRRRN